MPARTPTRNRFGVAFSLRIPESFGVISEGRILARGFWRKVSVVDNRAGGERRPRGGSGGGPRGPQPRGNRQQAPRSSGPNRARRAQPQQAPDESGDRGPALPPEIEARQLAPEIRGELTTLDKSTADFVARHLVAAGELLDEDPGAALEHARAARARSGRIAAVREAVGIAAYRVGDWTQALAELRAARRLGSKSALLPLIADCERGVGRPERAIELARSPEAAQLTGDDADELRIVVAGARIDLGQADQALAILSTPQLDPTRTGQTPARLFYAYAETLLALGKQEEALQWFINAAAADVDGVTDAEERITEFT
jgi:tetratricopeptide (TPR) repeat protein